MRRALNDADLHRMMAEEHKYNEHLRMRRAAAVGKRRESDDVIALYDARIAASDRILLSMHALSIKEKSC